MTKFFIVQNTILAKFKIFFNIFKIQEEESTYEQRNTY